MRFANRTHAGALLADALSRFIDEDTVIYAMPRGGAVTAAPIAKQYGVPLEFAITRKIPHPNEPEYAIGAVAETGEALYDEDVRGVDAPWKSAAEWHEREEAIRRRRVYARGGAPIPARGKTAIIVDDGAATGLSMRLAIKMLRQQRPKRIIVALPVAPALVARALEEAADGAVVLAAPDVFAGSVGIYYDEFEQVPDEEVVRLYVELHDPHQPTGRGRPRKEQERRIKSTLLLHE